MKNPELISLHQTLERITQENLRDIDCRMKKKIKRLATLSAKEDREWVGLFKFFKNHGRSDAKADKLAWHFLQQLFPRLKKYDGAKP